MYISTLATIILAASPMISAVNYRGYTSTTSCSGSSFGCSDGGAVCCGSLPAGYGYSAQFDNLPAGSQGQGYTGGCGNFVFAVYGSGTHLPSHSPFMSHASWTPLFSSSHVLPHPFKHPHLTPNFPRHRPRTPESNENCSPHFFSYPDAEGKMRDVKVDDAEHAAVLADLYKNRNFSALEKVEEYKH
ncbi:MAG: hypothetical protein Q9200_001379 [Gallowayella weberi]